MSLAFQRHPRMSLRPEQHSHIAAAYDKAAFDITLSAHTRAAFARKADWFRLRARVGKKIEAALAAKQKAHEIESTRLGSLPRGISRLVPFAGEKKAPREECPWGLSIGCNGQSRHCLEPILNGSYPRAETRLPQERS